MVRRGLIVAHAVVDVVVTAVLAVLARSLAHVVLAILAGVLAHVVLAVLARSLAGVLAVLARTTTGRRRRRKRRTIHGRVHSYIKDAEKNLHSEHAPLFL